MSVKGVITPKRIQKMTRLAEEYFHNGQNLVEAMKVVGYKAGLHSRNKLMLDPIFKARLKELQTETRQRYQLDEDWVIQRLMNIGDSSLGDIVKKLRDNHYDLSQLSFNERYAISEFAEEFYTEGRGDEALEVKKVKIKVYDKVSALVALCRKLSLFNDKLKITADDDVVARLFAARDNLNKAREDDAAGTGTGDK